MVYHCVYSRYLFQENRSCQIVLKLLIILICSYHTKNVSNIFSFSKCCLITIKMKISNWRAVILSFDFIYTQDSLILIIMPHSINANLAIAHWYTLSTVIEWISIWDSNRNISSWWWWSVRWRVPQIMFCSISCIWE